MFFKIPADSILNTKIEKTEEARTIIRWGYYHHIYFILVQLGNLGSSGHQPVVCARHWWLMSSERLATSGLECQPVGGKRELKRTKEVKYELITLLFTQLFTNQGGAIFSMLRRKLFLSFSPHIFQEEKNQNVSTLVFCLSLTVVWNEIIGIFIICCFCSTSVKNN